MQASIRETTVRQADETEPLAAEANAGRQRLDLRTVNTPPQEDVFDALESVPSEETLVVIADAAPIPLYDRLDASGWSYEAIRADADEWRIHITDADSVSRSGERLRRPRRQRLE